MSPSYSSSSDEESESSISRSPGLVSNISSSSCSSLPQAHHRPPGSRARAMEDDHVWNDMNNLASLHHLHNDNNKQARTRITRTFQDFFGSPFDLRLRASSSSSTASPHTIMPQNPATAALSLNAANFMNGDNSLGPMLSYLPPPYGRNSRESDIADHLTPRFPSERKNKRIIKNRESAARSRARKQAYTMDLERRIEQMQEENNNLKKQLELNRESQLQAHETKMKHGLRRSFTAFF